MNEIDDRIIHNVMEWLSHAKGDLDYAKVGLTLETEQAFRLVAFHAQQCAEKSLKAYLVYHKTDFPYTHNISAILALCEKTADWVNKLQDAKILTPYASTLRYPGENIAVTKEEAEKAIGIAEHAYEVLKEALIKEGLELE